MPATRRFTVDERRARLAWRHGLAAARRAADVVEAARRMVCLHGTDPATICSMTGGLVTQPAKPSTSMPSAAIRA